MPKQGGRYVVRGGKRELVHRTGPAPKHKPEAKAAPAKASATAEPKPAGKTAEQKSVEENGHG